MALRRTILITAAAVALAALPTAAAAYDAPGYTTTVSDPTPGIGESFTVTTTGADQGDELTLTISSDPASISNDSIQIAGTQSLAKTAGADGSVTWTVTLLAAGTYSLAVTDAAGNLLGDATVVVAAAGPVDGALGDSGFDAVTLGGAALVLLATGLLATVVAWRRPRAHSAA